MFEDSKKIIVSGLQRSGHHAVAVWLAHQEYGVRDFQIQTLTQWFFFVEHFGGINYLLNNPLRIEEGEGKEHFDALFSEYEYTRPKTIVATHGVDECSGEEIKEVLSKSGVFDIWSEKVIVLRDFYNWAASCLGMTLRDEEKPLEQMFNETHIETYIDHCERYLDKDPDFDFVLFNEWAQNKSYRQEVAESLGLDFTDAAREQASIFGGGSSFDGLDYLKKASHMKVNERYLKVWDNPIYQDMIKRSPRAINMSERIFYELCNKTHAVS